MSQIYIESSIKNDMGHIVFSNPGKLNALPQSAWLAIPEVVDQLVGSKVRVLIISGDSGNFCAGADISEFDVVRKNEQTARIYEKSNIDAFAALRNAPVPTIASIDGYCLGGGFGLASACDLRIATTKSRFSVPAAKLGLGYPVEAMADIVNAVGRQHAAHMLYSAEQFSAQSMKEMGFLLDIVGEDELAAQTNDLACAITKLAPLTHSATKASIAAALGGDKEFAQVVADSTFSSQDYIEGRQAFRQKRAPGFTGE